MFHLLISSRGDSWKGNSETMLLERCLRSKEYTPARLINQYCQFTPEQNRLLIQLPAIFGFESDLKQDARLGQILGINKSGQHVEIDFQFLDSYPPIPNDVLHQLRHQLDVDDSEFYRGHWSLKDEDLSLALTQVGYPGIPFTDQPLVNIRNHDFNVALSFPGEARPYIEAVAKQLVRVLGKNTVFYDNFYKSQLAAPNLDTALQDLYGNRSKLIVVFLSEDYANKKWCGIEFRSIRKIINSKQDERVMFVCVDDAEVEGVFDHDGYVDANKHSEIEVASMIHERVRLLHSSTKQPNPINSRIGSPCWSSGMRRRANP